LKDNLSKSQQRLSQMEAAAREHGEQMHREMEEAKQQQTVLETELRRSKTQNEAMAHEIALLKADLVTSHESIESRYKAQISAERSKHRAEIARLKEQFANESRSGNSSDEQLLNALAQIDSLKSEKAALMVMLQSQKANPEQSLLRNIEVPSRDSKGRFMPLAAVVPRDLNWVHRNVAKSDVMLGSLFGFFGARPVARTVVLVWILIVHIVLLVRLF